MFLSVDTKSGTFATRRGTRFGQICRRGAVRETPRHLAAATYKMMQCVTWWDKEDSFCFFFRGRGREEMVKPWDGKTTLQMTTVWTCGICAKPESFCEFFAINIGDLEQEGSPNELWIYDEEFGCFRWAFSPEVLQEVLPTFAKLACVLHANSLWRSLDPKTLWHFPVDQPFACYCYRSNSTVAHRRRGLYE